MTAGKCALISFGTTLATGGSAILFRLPLDYGACLLVIMVLCMYLTIAFFLQAIYGP
jgi:hypothetical protein